MANGRSPAKREADLEIIASRYLKGETQASIGAALGLAQQTVSDDLRTIRSRWLESSIRDFDSAKSIELAKIDLVESEYWQQWERSKELKRTRKNEEGMSEKGELLKQTTIEEQRCGNPQYLAGVMVCIERRCRLLGLDSEIKYQDLTIAIGRVVQAGFNVQSAEVQSQETDS